jgi:hypothetical protein
MSLTALLISGLPPTLIPLLSILASSPTSPQLFTVSTVAGLCYIVSLLLSSIPCWVYVSLLGHSKDGMHPGLTLLLVLLPGIAAQFLLRVTFCKNYQKMASYVSLLTTSDPSASNISTTIVFCPLPSCLVFGLSWSALKCAVLYGTFYASVSDKDETLYENSNLNALKVTTVVDSDHGIPAVYVVALTSLFFAVVDVAVCTLSFAGTAVERSGGDGSNNSSHSCERVRLDKASHIAALCLHGAASAVTLFNKGSNGAHFSLPLLAAIAVVSTILAHKTGGVMPLSSALRYLGKGRYNDGITSTLTDSMIQY